MSASHDDRKLKETFGNLADHIAFKSHKPNNFFNAKERYILETHDAAMLPLVRRQPSFLRWLDYGCGTGTFSRKLIPYSEKLVGVDISSGLIEIAKKYCNQDATKCSFLVSDGKSIPLSNETIDRVVVREVLCCVPDEDIPGIVREFHRVLDLSGKIYLIEQVSESSSWQSHPNLPGLKKRSVNEIIKLFAEGGFELEESEAVRQPRFPWIYPIWFGFIPNFLIPVLARLEVNWNRHFCPIRTKRWQNVLFIFRRVN